MDKLKTLHHSLADWTFQPDHHYFLDVTQYVSSPSSLCTPLPLDYYPMFYVFLNEAVSGAVNDGKFITLTKVGRLSHDLYVWFRQTNDLSSCEFAGFGDGYLARWNRFNNRIGIYRAGIVLSWLTGVPNPAVNQWHAFKVLWYSYINPNLDRVVRIWCYVKVNADWYDCGYCEDSNPLHEGDPVNRVGFAIGGPSHLSHCWADDTEIWTKA